MECPVKLFCNIHHLLVHSTKEYNGDYWIDWLFYRVDAYAFSNYIIHHSALTHISSIEQSTNHYQLLNNMSLFTIPPTTTNLQITGYYGNGCKLSNVDFSSMQLCRVEEICVGVGSFKYCMNIVFQCKNENIL